MIGNPSGVLSTVRERDQKFNRFFFSYFLQSSGEVLWAEKCKHLIAREYSFFQPFQPANWRFLVSLKAGVGSIKN